MQRNQSIEIITDRLNEGLISGNTMPEIDEFELGYRLSIVNSEKRIMQLGTIALTTLEDKRVATDAHQEYVDLVPGIEKFYGVANFVLDAKHSPTGFIKIENPNDSKSPASVELSLTPLGKSVASLGGDLLDLSYRRNISLRNLLGKTHNEPVVDINDPPINTQERLLNTGLYFMQNENWSTTNELIDADIIGINSIKTLDNILASWRDAKILIHEKNEEGRNIWKYSNLGIETYTDLTKILNDHKSRNPEAALRGELLLNDYLTNPEKKRNLPMLFRRDYIATGGKLKAKVEKFGNELRSAIEPIKPDTILTTGDISDVLGREISAREMHRLIWWLGSSSVLKFEHAETRRTYWRVMPQKRPSDALRYR